MTKRKDDDSAAEIVARALATLIAGRKFFAHEASDLHEAFGHITAAVLAVGKLQKRLAAVETELANLKRLRSIA